MLTRRYRKEDIPEILELVHGFVADAPAYKRVQWDGEVLLHSLEHNLTNITFFCNVAIVDEKLVGGFAARLFQYAFSKDVFAQDILLYALPEYRSWSMVSRLHNDYTDWAKARRAITRRFSISSGYEFEGFPKLAERLGYTLIGSVWEAEVEQ